jgi:lysophospholipase L1-like esterase
MTIVAFGDSITAANHVSMDKKWVELIRARLKGRGVDIINSGIGGNTSREGLARIDEDVIAHKPSLVFIEFGGNDATRDPARHVTLKEFEENLHSMHKQITASTGARIVLLTFPPIIDDWHAWGRDEFYAPDGCDLYVEKYRQATRNYASSQGLQVADIDNALRRAIRDSSAERYILPDGIHLTEEGHAVVAKTVLGLI